MTRAQQLTDEATQALRAIVGESNVVLEVATREAYETATFLTRQQVLAIVLPGSTNEVQQIVALANRFKLALYPISRGRNWGLGSKVPVHDGSVVLDLRRMDRILDFNAELSYVTVEPGVTFRQLADFLKHKGEGLYLSAIGGPPDASVLGNTLERGDGLGPLGDRSEHCCALQAVLGTGELLNTGMAMFGDGPMSPLAATGLGPDFSGLFFQSNFAIVTRLTVWLARVPAEFQGLTFAITKPANLAPVVRAVRDLQQQGVIKANSFALWNMHKFLASSTQYPFTEQGKPLSSPEQLLAHVPLALRGVSWVGMGALYSSSAEHARADRRSVKAALSAHVTGLSFVNRHTELRTRLAAPLASKILGMDAVRMLPLLYSNSPFLGNPTEFSIQSVYWRKRGQKPAQLDPDRDRCGLLAKPARHSIDDRCVPAGPLVQRVGAAPEAALRSERCARERSL